MFNRMTHADSQPELPVDLPATQYTVIHRDLQKDLCLIKIEIKNRKNG